MPSNQSPGQAFDRPLIQAQNVSRQYRLGEAVISAVNDVSLEIRAGEFLALLGRSGSGKSTFLNLLAGAEAQRLQSGEQAGEAFGANS